MTVLAREVLRGTEHPSTKHLIAYQRGRMPPAEEAAIREHLSLCQECTGLVLDAADFFADDQDEEATPADLEASWQRICEAMRIPDERSPAPALALGGPLRSPLLQSLAFAYALAATFAAVSVGLFVFAAGGKGPPLQPQANVRIYDLTSSNSQRGDETKLSSIRFRSPVDSALLILNPAQVPAPSAQHGVRIRRGDAALVWQSEDLAPEPTGGFHLGLPAGALLPGKYHLELYEIAAGRETPLGNYSIAIEK
jgi:hypothetical protein